MDKEIPCEGDLCLVNRHKAQFQYKNLLLNADHPGTLTLEFSVAYDPAPNIPSIPLTVRLLAGELLLSYYILS